MDKVYNFTNEFVAVYPRLYKMDNANILSILGSGDQYFTAILNGAKNVDVIDINKISWYYFVLKFMAIKYLSYQDFIDFFIVSKIDNLKIYKYLRESLPNDVKLYFDKLSFLRIKFSSIIINSQLSALFKLDAYKRYIPYMNEEDYYKLQGKLRNISLPNFYQQSFEDFLKSNNGNYDLMLLSNIFHWLSFEPKEFKCLLKKANAEVIQALYTWNYTHEVAEFVDLGFEISSVPPVKRSEFTKENFVLTYKRTK